jgi:hypothetical protein
MHPDTLVNYIDLWFDLGKQKMDTFDHFQEKDFIDEEKFQVLNDKGPVMNGMYRQLKCNFPVVSQNIICSDNFAELMLLNLINVYLDIYNNQIIHFKIYDYPIAKHINYKLIVGKHFIVSYNDTMLFNNSGMDVGVFKGISKVFINREQERSSSVIFNILPGTFLFQGKKIQIVDEMKRMQSINKNNKFRVKTSVLFKLYYNDAELTKYFADMDIAKYSGRQQENFMVFISKQIKNNHLIILHNDPKADLSYIDDSAFFNYIFRYRYINSFSKQKELDRDKLGCYLAKQTLRNAQILETIAFNEVGVQLVDSIDNKGVFSIMTKNANTVHGYCWTPSVEAEADVELDLQHYYHLCSPIFREKKNMLIDTAYKWIMRWWSIDAIKHSSLSNNYLNIIVVSKSTAKSYIIMPANHHHYTEVDDLLNSTYYLSTSQYNDFISRFKKQFVENIDKYLNKDSKIYHSFAQILDQLEKLVDYKSQYSRYYPSPVTNKNLLLYSYNEIINQYRGNYQLDGHYYKNAYDKIDGKRTSYNLISAWLLMNTTVAEVPCCCKDKLLHKLLPTPSCYNKSAMIYNNCLRTTFAAFKRQCKLVPKPDKQVLDEYIDFVRKFYSIYIERLLDDFDYSYNQWFNKNTKPKQDDLTGPEISRLIDQCQYDIVLEVVHNLFCKIEKQEPGGKNRAISAIIQIVKYIMGPVTWRVEETLGTTKLYCGKKNADDDSNIYTKMMKANKKVVEGDGSGFDQTQHMELKYIDRLIYNKVKEKVWHVNKETFINTCVTPIKTLNGDFYINKKKRSFIHGQLYGTVFSGSSDTTLMNTVRMTTYNLFTLYKAGLFNFQPDYQGLHKGDDFVEFVNHDENADQITQTYYKYWAKKGEKVYSKGIGQIIKIIEVLPIEKSSFCSCIVIKSKDKLYFVRDPKRMVRFAPFARKTAYYKEGMIHQYLEDQAVALEQSGLKKVPFYKTFIKAYRNEEKKYTTSTTVYAVGAPKVTRTPDQPELLCKVRSYRRNTELEEIVIQHPILGKIKTKRIKGKKYIYSDEVKELSKPMHKWFDDKTVKYDNYLENKDYYYSRIKNDRAEQIDIDENSFYSQLNQRYTNDKCDWSQSQVKKYEDFLLNPDTSMRFEQYTLLDKGSYNEDVV